MDKLNSREVQVTLCEKCNLNCVYCYEHNKDSTVMDFELAKKIITGEFLYAKKHNLGSLKIYFHGGEICLCFNLLKQICEWIWSEKWPVNYICSATTNGTLVHGDIQRWFKDNADRFVLSLSLDGNKLMHDMNRNGSYDRIDLDFFYKTWPWQDVKMTISPSTLPYLSEGIIDVAEKGFKMTANLAYGCDWESDELKYQYARELFKLTNYFISHPALTPPKRLMQKTLTGVGRSVYFNKPFELRKGCGAGTHMCCYDMQGRKYPCQMFMPSSLGEKKYEGYAIEESKIEYSSVCKECPIVAACPTCIGSNYVQHGELIKKEDSMCDYFQIEIYNYTYFLYKMLQNRDAYQITREMDDTSVAFSLKAIVYIQKQLKAKGISKYCVD